VLEARRDDQRAAPEGFDPRVHAAVTDMYAYVLLLDAERKRVGERLQDADEVSAPSATSPPASDQRGQLSDLSAELAEELDALRIAVAHLHEEGSQTPPDRADQV
jgi:hypothetical protein